MTITRNDIAEQVASAIEGTAVASRAQYDVDGIVEALVTAHGMVNIGGVDDAEFWSLVERHALRVAVTDVEGRWDDSDEPYVAHVFATADVAKVGHQGATGWPVDEDVEQVGEVAYGEDEDGTGALVAALEASGWRVVGDWTSLHPTANITAAHVVAL